MRMYYLCTLDFRVRTCKSCKKKLDFGLLLAAFGLKEAFWSFAVSNLITYPQGIPLYIANNAIEQNIMYKFILYVLHMMLHETVISSLLHETASAL